MMPLWLRRAIALLPPLRKPWGPLALTSYLTEFAGPEDGARVTWKPEKRRGHRQANTRDL